jgi:hypothetical protein
VLFLCFHPPEKSPQDKGEAFRTDEPGKLESSQPPAEEAIRAVEEGIQKS